MISPCDVGHRAQGIITLSDGDTGDLVHGQDSALLLGQLVHELRVLGRVNKAHQGGLGLQQLRLVLPQSLIKSWRSHLCYQKKGLDKAFLPPTSVLFFLSQKLFLPLSLFKYVLEDPQKDPHHKGRCSILLKL